MGLQACKGGKQGQGGKQLQGQGSMQGQGGMQRQGGKGQASMQGQGGKAAGGVKVSELSYFTAVELTRLGVVSQEIRTFKKPC